MGLTALILAGGLGRRLRPVLSNVQKVTAPVAGRPFLTHVLDQLSGAGAERVVLCTGYLGEQVRRYVDAARGTLRIIYSQETAPLGTAGAVRRALRLVHESPLLVMNGDSFCALDVPAFTRWHAAHRAAVSLALVPVNACGRYGQVAVDVDGSVMAFREKGGHRGPGWISAGVYLFGETFLEALRHLPAGRAMSLEHDVFPRWVGQGLYGYRTRSRFLDIGTPESYRAAEQFFHAAVQP